MDPVAEFEVIAARVREGRKSWAGEASPTETFYGIVETE